MFAIFWKSEFGTENRLELGTLVLLTYTYMYYIIAKL